MSKPLSAIRLDDLALGLSHPSLTATPGPESNVAYVSKEENDRLVSAALALGMGQFDKMTADETHRLAARLSRR
ncbi:hypothetical protein [Brevundimonas sp. SGAir0440]|uniref:hypothetical protein n=1 Tax=Brevundimonas sp. SGAir0440 TaxID=2579977 RepID=UPI0010CCF5CB|nr:hypothetical protein [Brevundimonas sp. SGAir0440]QCQ97767.1 hypothetical protein E7T10_03325 [Brevundimonas sp. SGAir0440]